MALELKINQKFKICTEFAAFLADDKAFKKKHSFSMTEYIAKGKSLKEIFINKPANKTEKASSL